MAIKSWKLERKWMKYKWNNNSRIKNMNTNLPMGKDEKNIICTMELP